MLKRIFIIMGVLIIIIGSISIGIVFGIRDIKIEQDNISSKTIKVIPDDYKSFVFEIKNDDELFFKEIVYDGMTLDELGNKLNKSLNSTLSNKGDVFAKVAIQYNVDPYLVTAIALHETGCKWNCSSLVKSCNNVGGVKGNPSCDGAYKYYDSIDEGIRQFIKNIKDNYYDEGLTNANLMQRKYTGKNGTWAVKINNYISSIKKA